MSMMATERKPSSPLCEECQATLIYCDACQYLDQGQPCCETCTHVRDLPYQQGT